MRRIRPKRPRQRLEPELYEGLREQALRLTAGNANVAELGPTWRFITKNFAARAVRIQKKT